MNRKTAKEVNRLVEDSISKLNEALTYARNNCDVKQYEKFRNSIAYPIGYLDDVLEKHIFTDYPEMRPYELD